MKDIKILLLEDDKDEGNLIIKILNNNFENIDILWNDRAELAFTSIPIFKPDIVISDYSFPTSTCNIIMQKLNKFKGLVIIYSSNSESFLRKALTCISDNMIIITKPNTLKVVSVIAKHVL